MGFGRTLSYRIRNEYILLPVSKTDFYQEENLSYPQGLGGKREAKGRFLREAIRVARYAFMIPASGDLKSISLSILQFGERLALNDWPIPTGLVTASLFSLTMVRKEVPFRDLLNHGFWTDIKATWRFPYMWAFFPFIPWPDCDHIRDNCIKEYAIQLHGDVCGNVALCVGICDGTGLWSGI